jgi:transposase
MARPTKLDIELQKRITDAIQGGVDKKVAAAMVNISEATLYRWLKGCRSTRRFP